jgi:hypothetical protein
LRYIKADARTSTKTASSSGLDYLNLPLSAKPGARSVPMSVTLVGGASLVAIPLHFGKQRHAVEDGGLA